MRNDKLHSTAFADWVESEQKQTSNKAKTKTGMCVCELLSTQVKTGMEAAALVLLRAQAAHLCERWFPELPKGRLVQDEPLELGLCARCLAAPSARHLQ